MLVGKEGINGANWSCLILWVSVLPDSEKKQGRNCLQIHFNAVIRGNIYQRSKPYVEAVMMVMGVDAKKE